MLRFDAPVQLTSRFPAAPTCLGTALARLEAQVAFPLLLRRFPAIVGAGEPLRRDQLAFRGYASLPVMATP